MDEVQDVQVSRETMDGRSDRNRYADMEVGGRQRLEQVVEIAGNWRSSLHVGRSRASMHFAALEHPSSSVATTIHGLARHLYFLVLRK